MSRRTITKFPLPLPLQKSFSLFFPERSRVLHIAVEGRKPYMWLEINHTQSTESVSFVIAGDIDTLPSDNLIHLGSFRYRWKMRHLFMYPLETAAVLNERETSRKLYSERNLGDT